MYVIIIVQLIYKLLSTMINRISTIIRQNMHQATSPETRFLAGSHRTGRR